MKTPEEIHKKELADLKEKVLLLAAERLVEFLDIIGNIGYTGFRVYRHFLQGHSYQKCAVKFRISKPAAQRIIKKCIKNRYGDALIKLGMLK